jgi:hypothetical protein
MKKVFVIILVFVFIAPLVMKTFSYVHYLLDFEYISENLCKNKDKPELQCNGKCYLNKQIAIVDGVDIEQEKAPAPSAPTKDTLEQPNFVAYSNRFDFSKNSCVTKNKILKLYAVQYRLMFSKSIFCPPKSY